GVITEFPVPGPYATLMEAVESFAGQMRTGLDDGDNARHYGYASDGRKYLSALAGDARPMPERHNAQWHGGQQQYRPRQTHELSEWSVPIFPH
ncbi:MAG: hypothetical protein RLZZ434_817, partial [Pseudomonadota bacterium]